MSLYAELEKAHSEEDVKDAYIKALGLKGHTKGLIDHKPPPAEYRNYLLERRDSLIPLDERSFKGAFYTPLAVVDNAYDLLAQTLGKNWQKNYIVQLTK